MEISKIRDQIDKIRTNSCEHFTVSGNFTYESENKDQTSRFYYLGNGQLFAKDWPDKHFLVEINKEDKQVHQFQLPATRPKLVYSTPKKIFTNEMASSKVTWIDRSTKKMGVIDLKEVTPDVNFYKNYICTINESEIAILTRLYHLYLYTFMDGVYRCRFHRNIKDFKNFKKYKKHIKHQIQYVPGNKLFFTFDKCMGLFCLDTLNTVPLNLSGSSNFFDLGAGVLDPIFCISENRFLALRKKKKKISQVELDKKGNWIQSCTFKSLSRKPPVGFLSNLELNPFDPQPNFMLVGRKISKYQCQIEIIQIKSGKRVYYPIIDRDDDPHVMVHLVVNNQGFFAYKANRDSWKVGHISLKKKMRIPKIPEAYLSAIYPWDNSFIACHHMVDKPTYRYQIVQL